jgi:YfiH family protein
VHSGQVHGTRVLRHPGGGPAGFLIADTADGHATRAAGVLVTVTVADCIPISIVDPERRALALLHGGWRGVAGGIVEAGVAALRELAGSHPEELFLHLGPAICGACYEVGPEVHAALGCEVPPENRPVDLRAIAARNARRLGMATERITTSAHCTRCGDSPFFSHRAGHPGRQVGVLGIKDDGAGPSSPELVPRAGGR